MGACPCGSGLNYLTCCATYIEGHSHPLLPEALMRSRYTAYSMGNIEYIEKTMKNKALVGFNAAKTALWANRVLWIDLRVINTFMESDDIGYVEFLARLIEGDVLTSIHETSEFYREKGLWFYVDGVHKLIKDKIIKRNSSCPCGGLKKFKNCHARDK